jgi:hypothetical protein
MCLLKAAGEYGMKQHLLIVGSFSCSMIWVGAACMQPCVLCLPGAMKINLLLVMVMPNCVQAACSQGLHES